MKGRYADKSIATGVLSAFYALMIFACILSANIYSTEAASPHLEIPVYHSIVSEAGDGISNDDVFADTYKFELKRVTANAPMPNDADEDVVVLDIKGEGWDRFGTISCDAPGRFEYTLREIAGERSEMAYDGKIYKVVITVPESMNPSLIIKDPNGSKPDEAEFVDMISEDFDGRVLAEVVTMRLPTNGGLSKEIDGTGEFRNTKFTFTATPDEATCLLGKDEVLSVTLDGEGRVMFDEITFTREGTYTYTIEEVKTKPLSWRYDTTKYRYSFTITQEKDEDGNAYSLVSEPEIIKIGDDTGDKIKVMSFVNTPRASNRIHSLVRTGDSTQFMVLMVMFVAAALALSFILAPRRRRRH